MIASILSALAGWGPELLATAAGIVLALVNMKRLRPAGIFVLLGFVALLLVTLLGIAQFVFALVAPRSTGVDYEQVNTVYAVGSLVRLPFELAGWALLLVGIFRRRDPAGPSRPAGGTPPGAGMPPGNLAPTFGQPPAGQPGFGPNPGQPVSGQPAFGANPGQPVSGQPAPAGYPADPGQPPMPGQPGPSAPGSDQPAPGHPNYGEPPAGPPYPPR